MLLVTIGYHTAIMIFGVLSLVLCPYLPRMLGGEVGFLLGLGFSIFFALNVAMILFLFLPGPAGASAGGPLEWLSGPDPAWTGRSWRKSWRSSWTSTPRGRG